MRNKKWISLAVAVVLTVTALPATVFAAKDGESKEELTKVTLNEDGPFDFLCTAVCGNRRRIFRRGRAGSDTCHRIWCG